MPFRSSWVLSVVMAALVVALVAAPAWAHMALSKAAPSDKATVTVAPTQVQLWFTQKPDMAVSRIVLSGASGEVKLGSLKVMDDRSLIAPIEGTLSDGTYTIAWQSAGDDGHVQKGQITFTLKRATASR
jgi:methionine-rich copper-binding protein CopC